MVSKKRLGELLIEAGVIDAAMLQVALGHQRRWGGRLGQTLLELKMAGEEAVVDALARKLGYEKAPLDELEPHGLREAIRLVPRELARRHHVFPYSADTSTLCVAMSDPTNLALADELRFRTNRRIRVAIGGDRQIAAAIDRHYPHYEAEAESLLVDEGGSMEASPPLAEPFEGGTLDDYARQLSVGRPQREPPAEDSAIADALTAAVEAVAPRPIATPLPRPVATPVPAAAPRPVATPAPLRPGAAPPPVRPVATPVPPPAPRQVAVAPAVPAAPAGRPPPPPPVPSAAPVPELLEVDGAIPIRELTPREVELLDALDRMASGFPDPAGPVTPAQATAVLLRLLVRKNLVSEQELLDELTRP